eukprot:gene8679-11728_t
MENARTNSMLDTKDDLIRENSANSNVKNIFSVFKINQHDISSQQSQDILDFESEYCKTLAWFGDQILSLCLFQIFEKQFDQLHFNSNNGNRQRSYIHDEFTQHTLTQRKELYARNLSMKSFLLSCTDINSRLSNLSINDHTYGTIFESILYMTYKINSSMDVVMEFTSNYCCWVDKNRGQIHDQILDKLTDNNFTVSRNLQDEFIFESQIKINDSSDADAHPTKFIKISNNNNNNNLDVINDDSISENQFDHSVVDNKKYDRNFKFFDFDSNYDYSADVHVIPDIVKVLWKSKTKRLYYDDYHKCCGVRKGNIPCMRRHWPDPEATHSGDLMITAGGYPQTRANHIPRGMAAYWSCCKLISTSPGCRRKQNCSNKTNGCLKDDMDDQFLHHHDTSLLVGDYYREIDEWMNNFKSFILTHKELYVDEHGQTYANDYESNS